MSRRLALALLVAVALAAPLAGCTARGGEAGVSNFSLIPERVGWNVTETARFTLSMKSSLLASAPEYVLDVDLAIEEVFLHERGWSPAGNVRTKDAHDLDFAIWKEGREVDRTTLGAGNESVGLALTLPENLKDSAYSLELKLFKVGWVRSDLFRVNVP